MFIKKRSHNYRDSLKKARCQEQKTNDRKKIILSAYETYQIVCIAGVNQIYYTRLVRSGTLELEKTKHQ